MVSFAEEKSLNRETSEKPIVQINFSSWIQESFRISPDSKHIAYAAMAGNKMFVVVDGKEEKQYDGLGSLIFSPDSKHVAYAVKASNKGFAVVDGKEGKQYDGIVTLEGGRVVFDSFDSLHYLAVKAKSIYLLVEEKIRNN
jgi:hypothetical protein